MEKTKGRGVDIILNTLAEEQLFESVRYLSRGGRFLEIGKLNLSSHIKLALELLKNNRSFHGISFEKLLKIDAKQKQKLVRLLGEGILNDSVKPLERTVYKRNEIENAFNDIARKKSTGKVVIEIRNEYKENVNSRLQFKGIPR